MLQKIKTFKHNCYTLFPEIKQVIFMFMDIDASIFETVSIRNDVDKDPHFNPKKVNNLLSFRILYLCHFL